MPLAVGTMALGAVASKVEGACYSFVVGCSSNGRSSGW